MTKNIRFYKNDDEWFADIPEWDGDIWELQMVAGADTFLDIAAQGESEIYLTMSTEIFDECEVLHFQKMGRLEGFEMGSGSWYLLQEYQGIDYNLPMWLCDVTKFVFGEFPNKIYFK
jgi:hypothetical protein